MARVSLREARLEKCEMEDLRSLFSEWDEAALQSVLQHSDGNVELAADMILTVGSPAGWWERQAAMHATPPAPSPQQLPGTQTPQSPPPGYGAPPSYSSVATPGMAPMVTGAAQVQQEMVVVTAPGTATTDSVLAINHRGAEYCVRVPPGVAPGGQFVVYLPAPAAQPPATTVHVPQLPQQRSKGRGRMATLPPDFLRVPGGPGTQAPGVDGGMSDEQLAQLLQNELFLQELAAHPEFGQLHQQRLLDQARSGNSGGSRAAPDARPAPGSPAPAAGAAASTSSATVSSMATAMKNRLKAFGRSFNRSRDAEYDGLETEEDALPWQEDGETMTYGGENTSNALLMRASEEGAGSHRTPVQMPLRAPSQQDADAEGDASSVEERGTLIAPSDAAVMSSTDMERQSILARNHIRKETYNL